MIYPALFSPGRIGNLELRNRVVLAAMGSLYANPDASCGERLWDYYEARARGGAGLLILETSAAAWPMGAATPSTVGFSRDEFVPGLTTLVKRVHRHGARIAAQINHCGKVAQEDVIAGRPVMVPSVPEALTGNLMAALTQQELGAFVKAAGPDGKGPRYHVMTQEDIDRVILAFADAASRAKEAGFDAIELHGGHGYLIASFLSPFFNRRDDEYGGDVANRSRLLTQIIRAVKDRVGQEFPLLVRLDAKEYRIEGGITPDAATTTAQLAVEAGADAIDVSAYGNGLSGIAFTEAPLVHEPGGLLPFAKTIKNAIFAPVIGVGRIEPDQAEKSLADGDVDFIAMGRKLLADPDLPNKLAEGNATQVRPCIYCYVCVSRIFVNSPMVCAVNPATGREAELDDGRPAEQSKRIAVVGGGPAGMELARTAAQRGHEVVLYEKEPKLGGTANIAALPYEPNGRLVDWLVDALERSSVDVRTGAEATPESLAADRPDHIVVATGAQRRAPPMPGAELDHVFDGDRLRELLLGRDSDAMRGLGFGQRLLVRVGRTLGLTRRVDLLRRMSKLWMPLGRRIVLVGGGLVGLELAEYLAERKRTVTVLEPSPHLGAELSIVRRARVLHLLNEAGVKLVTNAQLRQIDTREVHYETAAEGAQAVAADNVIISLGAAPDPSLAERLASTGIPVSTIGDCADVGYIEGAMLSARQLAVTL